MNKKNQPISHIGIPALCTLLLAGCYQDQTRNASEEDLLIAEDLATEQQLLKEIQQQVMSIEPMSSLEMDEPDPFELQQYPTHSIWPRVRDGFKIDTHLDHPWVQSELAWYARHPEYLYRTMTRAEPFLHYILEEAEKRFAKKNDKK